MIKFPPDIQQLLNSGQISYGAAATLRFMDEPGRASVCALFTELRPTVSTMKEIADNILDISKRDEIGVTEITSCSEITSILKLETGRKSKIEKLRNFLKAKRFPMLHQKEAALRTAVKNMALPQNISITYPENLEGKTIQVSIGFRTYSELKKAIDILSNGQEKIDELIELLSPAGKFLEECE